MGWCFCVCVHSVVEVKLDYKFAGQRGEEKSVRPKSGATHATALPTPARGAGHLEKD